MGEDDMKIGAQVLVHVPEGERGKLVTEAAAIAVQSLLDSDAATHDLGVMVLGNGFGHPVFVGWRQAIQATVQFVDYGRPFGFSEGRNAAYRSFQGEGWDAFIEFDIDNIFPGYWFSPLARILEKEERAGIVSPGFIMADHWDPNDTPTMRVVYGEQHYHDLRWRVTKMATICAAAYRGRRGKVRYPPVVKRRTCLEDIGLYDEGFVGGGWEDWDEVMRARTQGWEIVTCLDSFVFHWGAWERSVLGGWAGRNDDADETANRNRFFEKWPEGELARQEYLREWAGLYALE